MVTHLWAWRDAVMCDSNSTNSHVAAPWRRVRDTHTLTPTHAHLVYQCTGCLGSSMFLECLTTYFFLFFLLRAFFFSFSTENTVYFCILEKVPTPGSAQTRCQLLVWHSGLPTSDRTLILLEGRQ